MIGKLAYAVLVGVITFVVLSIVGSLLHIGLIIAYAGIIAVLVAIVTFFTRGPHNTIV